jgi:Xaa-Pro aminopeptidase
MFDRPFDRTEYADRVARVRQEMARRGLDGLLLTSGPNLTYLSGYPSPLRAGSRPFVFVLPLSGEPIFIVHTAREREAHGYSWVADIRTYRELSHAPVETIVDALRDTNLIEGRVGAELGPEEALDLPVGDFLTLQRRLPTVEFTDAGAALCPARLRKSPAEVASIRQACAITAGAYERTFAEAREGMTESDVARLMRVTSLEAGGGDPWVLITSGPGSYDLATKLPSCRRLERGDFVWMDAGCAVAGYWSDFGRAGVVGGATEEQREAQARIHEITMLGVELIRPGVSTGEIARRCNAALARLDLPVTSSVSGLAGRVGHGLGLMPTELPHVAEEDETVLAPGMVITVEPGVGTPYGLFHVEENVVVTEQGYEILSQSSRELATIAAE